MMQEALLAIRKTENTQIALDSGNSKAAFRSLEIALGKNELILARDPKLALAPIDVSMATHDILLSLSMLSRKYVRMRKGCLMPEKFSRCVILSAISVLKSS